MTDSTRQEIAAAFDRELSTTPVPPSLRSQAIRAAVETPQREAGHPRLLALVAAVLAVAIVATLVVGAHLLAPTPSRPTTPPSPRASASVVYDADRAQLLMFGGSGTSPLNETWTWDGKSWTRQHPKLSPQARADAVMADDQSRHVAVLFGGWSSSSAARPQQIQLNDTWTWDGHSWTQKHPQHSPAFTFTWPAAMGFDPVSRQVLLFGFTTDYKPQTWAWNGSDWNQLSPASSPNTTANMFSDGHHLYAIAAPFTPVGGRFVSQIWLWDGSSWQLMPPSSDTIASVLQSMAYDAQRNQLVMFDGDTWTWDASGWTRQHPQSQPAVAGYLLYMSSLHEVVSWGDRYGSASNEMWAWNGSTWKLLQPGTVQAPSPNSGKGSLGTMSPTAADAAIRQTVTASSPVLLPSWLPAGMEANVNATADGFSVDYLSDQRDKRITLGIVVPNPPPGGANSSDTRVSFRHITAEYFVYDTTGPYSQRWLLWFEPGTMAVSQTKQQGVVPYFLSAEGLTDQEFWQVAQSLK